jgi:hypothetical protein
MKSEMDSKDWLNDYPSLKQVSPTNPFTVPDGYFDELHQRAMSRAIIDGVNADTGFTVPEGYFDEAQANLQSRINIEAALNNSSGHFTVPDNYFEDMQACLQSRINIEAALQHTDENFTVPENYFEDLQQNITSRIAVEQALEGKTEGFTVPEHYFDKLQNAIAAKTTEAPKQDKNEVARKGIVRRLVTSGAFKYATAACFVLAIGGTLFIHNYENPAAQHERSYIHKALKNVDDADIIDYLQMHMDAADTRSIMDGADEINTTDANAEELKDYLSTH